MEMRDFRELKVWKKAHHFTLQVYRITKNFPSDERFGLTVQLRRAAASIPMNIAEAMVSEEIVSENLPGL
jgi:four helix bundle protein